LFVGYRRDWLWTGAGTKTIHTKSHSLIIRLDLSKWSDRSAYFLGRWHDLNTQLFIADLIRLGDTVIDVGANRGMFALVASKLVGSSGKVICFEPNPVCTELLNESIELNNIKNISVHPFGLGDREQRSTLSVPKINSGEGTFGKSAYNKHAVQEINARIKIGDTVVEDEHPSVIKIDVEGFEKQVVSGLARTIEKNNPIILTEIAKQLLEACGSSIAELEKQMQNFGYKGFELRLRKDRKKYTWCLVPPENSNRGYDAVWIHETSFFQYASVLNDRIFNRADVMN
jgi:FkbM family methyltransferase